MANRRPGGYGSRPNFNAGPNFNSGSVNPWQGGNVPGNQYSGGNSSNILSQLSEPQAQLALALTKLLQPQQQVPSLLSMNTNPPMQNRNYGPGNFGRSGPGNMGSPMNRRQPFNKMNNRNDGFKSNQMQRRPNRTQPKTINKNIKPQRSGAAESKDSKITKPSSTKASPTKSLDAIKTEKDVKAEPSAADTTISSVNDTDDKSEDVDTEDKKRDWKEEKNEESDKEKEKKNGETNEDDKEKNEDSENEKTDASEKRKSDCIYDDIPKDLFQCFICQKRMWDAKSFENHMKGRAHQQMCEKVDDSYRIKADMMREAIRLAEEKNNIEMERMKRLGKKTKNMQLSRCAMCDLEFYGQLFLHRKSSGHQKLKQFLHPKCLPCNKEFPTRMEWDNHRHTPEHLRKRAAVDRKQDQDDGVPLEEECFIVIDSTENEDLDDPNAITDLVDDLPDENIQVPMYKSNRAVGLSLIEPATGFFCKPCSKFFMTEKASQLHAQTKTHYNSFVTILNEKMAENEEKKRKAETEDDDEGNWKRRKTAKEGEENDEEKQDDADQNEDKKNNGNDLYDPMECDNEESGKVENKDVPLNTSSDLVTDPNDICLDIKSEVINDEVWKEVDTKIDEILDENSKASPTTTPNPSPAKTKSSARPQRAIRGRKH